MSRWVGVDGLEVEVIVLDRRQVLRVSRWYGPRRLHIADCPSVAALAELVDLASLVEVVDLSCRYTRRGRLEHSIK